MNPLIIATRPPERLAGSETGLNESARLGSARCAGDVLGFATELFRIGKRMFGKINPVVERIFQSRGRAVGPLGMKRFATGNAIRLLSQPANFQLVFSGARGARCNEER